MHGWDDGAREISKGMKELIQGTGGLCGGTHIDNNFLAFVAAIFPGWPQFAASYPSDVQRLRQNWESSKRSFDDSARDIMVDLPGRVASAMRAYNSDLVASGYDDEDLLIIKQSQMRAIFDPVLNQIMALIGQAIVQIAAKYTSSKPIVLLLVGGLSENQYIRQRLSREFAPRVSIYQPPHPASAVAKGACMFGLSPAMLYSRRVRSSFGTVVFRKAYHTDPPSYVEFDPVSKKTRVRQFDTFVHLDQELTADSSICRVYVPESPTQTLIKIDIFATKESIKYAKDLGDQKPEVQIELTVPKHLTVGPCPI